IAPTGEGREEVVGLGVVPPHAEMMLGAEPIKYRPLPAVEEAVDSGSLSDGAQPLEPPPTHWHPEAMPPRRSLDTIHPPARTAAHALPRRQMGHAYSSSMATIRLQQRPTELLRKGSSRDAIALGIDFDVKSIFEGSEDAADSDTGSKQLSSAKSSIDGRSSQERSEDAVSKLELLKQNFGEDFAQKAGPPKQKPRKKSAASIGIRLRRNETSFKIPLTNLRDERTGGSSTLLKRSATLPTKRAGASNYNANSAAHKAAAPATAANQKSRWVGGYTDEATPAPGWDDSDDDDVTPLSRRGGGTQTWYGPRANIRPISMFPATRANAPYLMPPVPLMFDQDTAAYVPPMTPTSSGLAALLATKLVVRHNPFSEEFGAVGGTAGDGSLVELNIFIQHSDTKSAPQTVRVRRTSTVEQAIGFALYRYLEDECKPALAPDVQDVVMWALRIAMDGEVDDDFPAFDRTRPVANFAFDEFALCLASPDQIKTNEAIRVRQGRPARMARPKSLTPATPLSAPASARAPDADSKEPSGLLNTITHRVETSAVVLQPSRIATASMAGIFVGTSVLQGVEGSESRDMTSNIELLSAAEPQQLRLLRVQMLGDPSSADALRATTIEADGNATIRMVLAQVCRKKQFLEDQYVLGVFDSTGFSVCSSDMRVAQLPPSSEMYLHRVGAALPTLRAPPASDAPLYGQQERQQIAIEDPTGAMLAVQSSAIDMAAAYYTFRVIRRAQMFTRHERSLVISGETIALMPFDHDAETAKTLTFHISNVMCKRNQKSPKKIRLFISRRGNTGEKSIDLEAESEEDAASICGILMRLGDHYNQTIGM
ncbi:Component of a membrane-bound complex containing the Tor2p kinase, partial [Coemansia sp. RSA 1878]